MKIFNILKEIAFERVGGTLEEQRAAEIIVKKLKCLGVKPYTEEFKILTFKPGKAIFSVTKPYKKSYKAYPVGLTGCGKCKGEFVYVETTEEFLNDIKDKIALIQGRVRYKEYRALVKHKAKGFISLGSPAREVIYTSIREEAVRELGRIPGISISFETALDLIKKRAKEVVFEIQQEEFYGMSKNVILELKGTKIPEEVIVICGHYDSVATSCGVIDNGAGTVTLLALAEHFIKHPARRTLRFIWFGSEEMGLLGSTNYADKHKNKLDEIKMVVNIDVGGAILGKNSAIITGSDDIKHFVEAKGKESGIGLDVKQNIASSDSLPFARNGVPSVNLLRGGSGTFYIHTCGDRLDFVDEKCIMTIKNFAQDFIEFMGNAKVFPFKKEIPDTVKKKVDEYYRDRAGS